MHFSHKAPVSSDDLSPSALIEIAVELGSLLLKSGAEIYRVEDTMLRLFTAYGILDSDVYVLSNGIFANLSVPNSAASSYTLVRRVPLQDTINLSRIIHLNQLARDICAHKCSYEEVQRRLQEQPPLYSKIVSIFCCGLGTSSFCYLFGGSIRDSLCAFAIGCVEFVVLSFFEKHGFSSMLTYVFTSIFISMASLCLQRTALPVSADFIIIGSIMPMVPGITLTTSIRDFYNSDYLSGTIHLINALLTALCIAVGVSISIYLFYLSFLGGKF